jgi:hypothetical protein
MQVMSSCEERIMMRISLSTGRARAAARVAAVVAITLASGVVVGVSSASASGGGCTDSNPEVCFGVNGSGNYVNWIQVQVHVTGKSDVGLNLSGPDFGMFTEWQEMPGSGWTQPFPWQFDRDVAPGWYCGSVTIGDGSPEDYKCVDVTT